MRRKYLFLLYISLSALNLRAQDTLYIKKYDALFSGKFFFYDDKFNLTDISSSTNYIPAVHMGLGGGIWCKYIPFDICVRKELHTSGDNSQQFKATDMQLRAYNKYFAGDIYIQKYRGFTVGDKFDYGKKFGTSSAANLNPDFSVFNYSMIGQYVFNGEKFSYKAGFTQNERQLKSAGSGLAGMSLYYLKVDGDSALLIDNQLSLTSFALSINGGYAHNFVPSPKVLLFFSVVLGACVSNDSFSNLFKSGTGIAPAFHFKGAAWFNAEKWSIGLVTNYNSVLHKFNRRYGVNLNTGRIELMFIRRIKL